MLQWFKRYFRLSEDRQTHCLQLWDRVDSGSSLAIRIRSVVCPQREERRTIVEKLILGERWIMDGTYPSSFDIRLPRTDLVLWVGVPRRVALISVYKRVYKYYGTTRSDMAEGCVEQLPDREFFVLHLEFQ